MLVEQWPDDASLVENCLVEYNEFYEQFEADSRKEKQINNLLVRVAESA
jgi:hypothetical protein